MNQISCLVITNNPQVAEQLSHLDVVSVEGSVLDLFIRVRDYVHRGHHLITHPLSGSLKPGKIPYKSVILTGERHNLDLFSLQLIESSIGKYHDTFSQAAKNIETGLLRDYAIVDLSHLQAALESQSSRLGNEAL